MHSLNTTWNFLGTKGHRRVDSRRNSLPQLNNETTERLQVQISQAEIEQAIDELSGGKSPGPDGLNTRFHKMFKTELSGLLQVVFEGSLQRGFLPPSFYRAHTVLIPQSKELEQLIKVTGITP